MINMNEMVKRNTNSTFIGALVVLKNGVRGFVCSGENYRDRWHGFRYLETENKELVYFHQTEIEAVYQRKL
jgi:hypothetical protein